MQLCGSLSILWDLYSSYIILDSHEQCKRVQFLHIIVNTCYFLFLFSSFVIVNSIFHSVGWQHIAVLIYISLIFNVASLVAQQYKNQPAMHEVQQMWVWSLAQEDPLEEGSVTEG